MDGDGAVAEGYSLPITYDLFSDVVAQYHPYLFDYDGLKPELKATKGCLGYGVTSSSLFVVVDMQIVAEHRRKGLSLLFLEEAFSMFRGTAQLAVMHAYPLQHDSSVVHDKDWEEKMDFGQLDKRGKVSSIGAVYYLGLALGFESLNEIAINTLCEEDLDEMFMVRRID